MVIVLTRVFAAIFLSAAWLSVIPLYGEPFGGCAVAGYLTLEPGCSGWPEFLQGFGVVLICALVGPRRLHLHYYVVVILAFVTVLGGFQSIKFGHYPDFTSLSDLMRSASFGAPLIIGAVIALALYLVIQKYRQSGISAA